MAIPAAIPGRVPAAGAAPSSGLIPGGLGSSPAALPAQRPEIIPNPIALAEQVSAWKLLIGIAAMAIMGSAMLLHLGRRDQRAMDAIHLDMMLGLQREHPGRPRP